MSVIHCDIYKIWNSKNLSKIVVFPNFEGDQQKILKIPIRVNFHPTIYYSGQYYLLVIHL